MWPCGGELSLDRVVVVSIICGAMVMIDIWCFRCSTTSLARKLLRYLVLASDFKSDSSDVLARYADSLESVWNSITKSGQAKTATRRIHLFQFCDTAAHTSSNDDG